MWVLPLGLDSKLRRMPWASLAFVGATVAISVVSFDQSQLNVRSRIQNEQKTGYMSAQRDLYLAECRERGYSVCATVEKDWDRNRPAWHMRAKLKRGPATNDEKDLNAFMDLLKTDPSRSQAEFKILGSQNEVSRRWLASRNEYFKLRQDDLKKLGQLTPENANLRSVIKAQFTHGSWMHLIGNMVVLAITLPFVEMRLGWLAASLLYMLAGVAGLWGYSNFMESDQALLGASAGVSAILGAFMVLFSKQRLRLWVSFFGAWNRTLTAPVMLSIPALFLASDLSGIMDRESSGVAHGAHLLGFLAGMLVAWGLDRVAPLPAGMSFPDEIDDLKNFRLSTDPSVQSKNLEQWWKTNPSGATFREHLQKWLIEKIQDPAASTPLREWSSRLLTMADLRDFDLEKIPPNEFYRVPWQQKDRTLLIAHADRRLRAGDWARALCLYDAAGDQSTTALIMRKLSPNQLQQLSSWSTGPFVRETLSRIMTPGGAA